MSMLEGQMEVGWYALRVHLGFEYAVAKTIENTVQSLNLKDKIIQVIVPTEKQIKIKGGKRTEKVERIFPGFVILNMVMDPKVVYVIKNIEHVTDFVGSREHAEPLAQEEIDIMFARMKDKVVTTETDLDVGDTVRISEGPFANMDGKISKIDTERGQATVLVNMFGRETPVKLDLFQIKRV